MFAGCHAALRLRGTAFVLAACSITVSCSSSDETTDRLLAYLTPTELVVTRDSDVIGRATGTFRSSSKLAWTHDGHSVMALSEVSSGDLIPRSLLVIDAQSGASRKLDCELCTSIATVGNSAVLASIQNYEHENSLLRFDLSEDGPPVRVNADVPEADYKRVVTSTRDVALLALADSQQVSIHGGPEQLFAVKPDGAALPLGSAGGDREITTAAAIDRDGKVIFAVDGGFVGSACLSGGVFTLIDGTTGTMTKTDTSKLIPNNQLFPVGGGSDVSNGSIRAYHLWWDTDGQLNGTLQAWTCDDEGKATTTSPWSHWKLGENRWVQVSSEPVLKIAYIDDKTTAVLVPIQNDPMNTRLVLKHEGQQTEIAKGVIDISTPINGSFSQ